MQAGMSAPIGETGEMQEVVTGGDIGDHYRSLPYNRPRDAGHIVNSSSALKVFFYPLINFIILNGLTF